MISIRVQTALLALLALPALAAAQGIGDAATQEKQRRVQEKRVEPGKVYSNEDLVKGRPPGQPAESEAQPSESTPTEDAPEVSGPSEYEQRAVREKEFEAAVEAAKAQLAAAQRHMEELAQRLNPLSSSFVYGAGGSLDLREESRIREELQEQPAKVEEARQAIQAAQDALDDFRNGRTDVAPGGGTQQSPPPGPTAVH